MAAWPCGWGDSPEGCSLQFGNDAASSGVWVAVMASVVGLPACPRVLLVLHRVAVESELRGERPGGNDNQL